MLGALCACDRAASFQFLLDFGEGSELEVLKLLLWVVFVDQKEGQKHPQEDQQKPRKGLNGL